MNRQNMYLRAATAATHVLEHVRLSKWSSGGDRRLLLAGMELRVAEQLLGTVIPLPASSTPLVREHAESIATQLLVMSADALHPDRPTPDDASFKAAVVALLTLIEDEVQV